MAEEILDHNNNYGTVLGPSCTRCGERHTDVMTCAGMVDRWSADVGSGVIRVAGIDASPAVNSGMVDRWSADVGSGVIRVAA